MIKMLLLSCAFLLCLHDSYAQREYAICDSTFYPYNADSTIVAGRKHLYYQTIAGLTECHNFTTTDTAEYIRDFDIVKPNLWYALVGQKYIGGPTNLFKSTDRGVTWVADTSFYTATKYHPTDAVSYYNSVNQLQNIGNDTIILFVGYYESGLVYSTDGGATWTEWFRNQIAHYQGLIDCGGSYYLYGFNGDGFRSWMFSFAKSDLFSDASGGDWVSFANMKHPNCSGSVNPGCIYVPSPTDETRCAQYGFLKNYADSVCPTVGIANGPDLKACTGIVLQPNPSSGRFIVSALPDNNARVRVYDMTSREISAIVKQLQDGRLSVSLGHPITGMYTVVISSSTGTEVRRILIE